MLDSSDISQHVRRALGSVLEGVTHLMGDGSQSLCSGELGLTACHLGVLAGVDEGLSSGVEKRE